MAVEFSAAALALERTLAGEHLDQALDAVLLGPAGQAVVPASRPAVRDMAYAAVRDLGYGRFLAARLNRRPPAPALAALQLVALSQLRGERRSPAVVVDQAVAGAREASDPGLRAAAGFLNATLRRLGRERATLEAEAQADPEASSGHPRWWLELVQAAYPDQWSSVVRESLQQAPLTLRVNARRLDRDEASRRLAAAGLETRVTGAEALTLAQALPVQAIPGFDEGLYTVQDAGAQLAAPLLDVRDGDRVLDACAAPGGKTTHLLQRAACRVLALDIDPARARRIRENLAREGLPEWTPAAGGATAEPQWGADVRVADAARPAEWWDGELFERILVDAPCSASGIVRRHPDVLWHRRRRDPATFGRQQQQLLQALWPLLKPGGKLLFVTCSIFPQEGIEVIDQFCSQYRNCEREPIAARWADGEFPLSQLVPTRSGQRDHDGYFYALLNKQT